MQLSSGGRLSTFDDVHLVNVQFTSSNGWECGGLIGDGLHVDITSSSVGTIRVPRSLQEDLQGSYRGQ